MSLFSGIEVPKNIGVHDSGYAIIEANAAEVKVSADSLLVGAPRLVSFLGEEIEKSGHNASFCHGMATEEEVDMLFDIEKLLIEARERNDGLFKLIDSLGLGDLPVSKCVTIEDEDISGIQHACYYYQASAREMVQVSLAVMLEILHRQNLGLTYVVSHNGVHFIDCKIS